MHGLCFYTFCIKHKKAPFFAKKRGFFYLAEREGFSDRNL
jgi:hypothetical protein